MCNLTKNLKKAIENSGYSVNKIAEISGVPQSTLASILKSGVEKAGVNNVIKICRAINITIDDLRDNAVNNVSPLTNNNIDGYILSADTLKVAKAFDQASDHIKEIVMTALGLANVIESIKLKDA